MFVAGSIVEVWPAKEWREYVQKLAREIDQLQEQVIEHTEDEEDAEGS